MKVETYKCDACGKQKGEVNHWWLGFEAGTSFAIRPWNSVMPEQIDIAQFHICGAECAHKKLDEFLSKER